MKSRLLFLLFSAAVLIGAFALAGRLESPAAPAESVTLFAATDLHYIAPSLTDNGEAFTELVTDADGKVMLKIDPLVRAFAAQCAAERPDAVIITGDLSFNGARESHEALAAILAGIEEAGVPVYVMPGNHDLYSSMAARFSGDEIELAESVTASEFAGIYAEFGFDEALSRDTASLSYSVRLAPGLRLVMVDANTYSNPGWVAAGTLEWVEAQLIEAESSGERVIAASHQNLYAHSPLLMNGYMLGNSAQLEALYAEYGVIVNLSGHIHLQHIRAERNPPEIAGSSLAVSPNQYGVLTLGSGRAAYHTESVDAAAWAEREGTGDEELLNFAEYSRGFFYDTAVAQGLAEAGARENAIELAEYYAGVNTLYFAGRCDEISWDEELMDAWSGSGFFIPMYLESIRASGAEDHTELSWEY